MIENLTNSLVAFNKEIAVVVLAAMPVSELRGAIPLGLAMGFSPVKTYVLAFAGNPASGAAETPLDRGRHRRVEGLTR